MPILLGIHSYIYEVLEYCNNHPGEGILNIYLKRFHRKNTTDLFERYHNTNEPDELLIAAKNNNFKKTEQGIAFVCPFFFKRRIPKFFHYINNDNLQEYLETVFIEELELSVRAYNCLKRANVHTLSDLLQYSSDDLLEFKNFGQKF